MADSDDDDADDVVQTVRNILIRDAGVAAILDDRVFPNGLPDATDFPAAVVTKATTLGNYDNAGDVGVEEARVQVDCYAVSAGAVHKLRKNVRRTLSGFRGGPQSGDPCAIQACFVINELDLTEPITERAGPRLRRRMIEFRVWNTEV